MHWAYDYNVSAGMRQEASELHLLFVYDDRKFARQIFYCIKEGYVFMEPDVYSLSRAGFSKERIEEIIRCDDKEIQIRMLRKCRCQLLDEIHKKQQSLDEIDYIICKMKERK